MASKNERQYPFSVTTEHIKEWFDENQWWVEDLDVGKKIKLCYVFYIYQEFEESRDTSVKAQAEDVREGFADYLRYLLTLPPSLTLSKISYTKSEFISNPFFCNDNQEQIENLLDKVDLPDELIDEILKAEETRKKAEYVADLSAEKEEREKSIEKVIELAEEERKRRMNQKKEVIGRETDKAVKLANEERERRMKEQGDNIVTRDKEIATILAEKERKRRLGELEEIKKENLNERKNAINTAKDAVQSEQKERTEREQVKKVKSKVLSGIKTAQIKNPSKEKVTLPEIPIPNSTITIEAPERSDEVGPPAEKLVIEGPEIPDSTTTAEVGLLSEKLAIEPKINTTEEKIPIPNSTTAEAPERIATEVGVPVELPAATEVEAPVELPAATFAEVPKIEQPTQFAIEGPETTTAAQAPSSAAPSSKDTALLLGTAAAVVIKNKIKKRKNSNCITEYPPGMISSFAEGKRGYVSNFIHLDKHLCQVIKEQPDFVDMLYKALYLVSSRLWNFTESDYISLGDKVNFNYEGYKYPTPPEEPSEDVLNQFIPDKKQVSVKNVEQLGIYIALYIPDRKGKYPTEKFTKDAINEIYEIFLQNRRLFFEMKMIDKYINNPSIDEVHFLFDLYVIMINYLKGLTKNEIYLMWYIFYQLVQLDSNDFQRERKKDFGLMKEQDDFIKNFNKGKTFALKKEKINEINEYIKSIENLEEVFSTIKDYVKDKDNFVVIIDEK
jgi:hypothetical protein